MYRQYEDARALEARLKELEKNYHRPGHTMTVEEHEELEDLKGRVRFAWADEYEEEF